MSNNGPLVLVTILSAAAILAVLAKRLRIPYPIALVFGGIALAFARHLPRPNLDPQFILLVVLPPLLYGAAWTTDWQLLKKNWKPVSLLAIGLVVFTTVVVAVVVHAIVPGFTWALAFTLGAIVSPPDAVAAEAVFERIAVPRRVASIVSGECLLNDATALVLYRFAVIAAVAGTFSLSKASVDFVLVALGGVAIGVVVAFALEGVLRYIAHLGFEDASVAGVIFLIAPFASYLPAEALHVSGVLAAVATGIVLGQRSTHFIDSETRVAGTAVWKMLIFLLNAYVFLLIGTQLPYLVAELEPHVGYYAIYAAIVVALVILVRIVWVFPAVYLPYFLRSKRSRAKELMPSWRSVTVIAWAGMRGIVSLAVALALPYTLGDDVFLQRPVLLFFTVCVVFVTLVLQGLTLRPLIEWLGVSETSKEHARETRVRIRALEAAVARMEEVAAQYHSPDERDVAARIAEQYRRRIAQLRGGADGQSDALEIRTDRRLQKEALDAERGAILNMRQSGEVPDEIYRSIEYDLDLAALRLSGG